MRQQVLDYIATLSLGGYLLTEEIPWSDNDVPLYIKNLKKIYVDNTEYASTPVIQTLGALSINNEETISTIYFANDAKTVPANYDILIADLQSAKDITTIEGVRTRECDVTVSYQDDIMITEIEIRLTRLKP
jgi:hypothetical protein